MMIDASFTRKQRFAPSRLWRIGQLFYQRLSIIFVLTGFLTSGILWFTQQSYEAEMTVALNRNVQNAYSKQTLLEYLTLPNHYVTTAKLLGFPAQELTQESINNLQSSIHAQAINNDDQFIVITARAQSVNLASAILNAYWTALNQNANDYFEAEQQQMLALLNSENASLVNLFSANDKSTIEALLAYKTKAQHQALIGLEDVLTDSIKKTINDLYYQDLSKEPLFIPLSQPIVLKQTHSQLVFLIITLIWAIGITLLCLFWIALFNQNLYASELTQYLSAPVWTFRDAKELVFFSDELRRLSSKPLVIFMPNAIAEYHRDLFKYWLKNQGILNFHLVENFSLLSAYVENSRIILILDAVRQHYSDVVSIHTLLSKANIPIEGIVLLNSL